MVTRQLFRRTLALALLPITLLECSGQEIRRVVDLAPVWAGHPVGFHSLVHGERQYVAFYDANRQMTVASRDLASTNWSFMPLPEKVGWDSHNYITMAVDNLGYLHLSGNMHAGPLVYFRSDKPLEASSLKRASPMTGQEELRTTYPAFFQGPAGEMIFTYRTGASGKGDQIYNVYDSKSQQWRGLLDEPLVAGEGQRSAYLNGPMRGPDGYFHLCWIWRATPDCSSSHYICYARSRDLVRWETSAGKPLALPITFASCEVIDPVPQKGGAINGNVVLGFDAQKRPIVSYHKFDTNGFTQVYNARLENGRWQRHQVTDWKSRWEFGGGGSIPFDVRVGAVSVDSNHRLVQNLSNKAETSGTFFLDEETLRPSGVVPSKPRYPSSLKKVRSNIPGMMVHLQPAGKGSEGVQLWLRWETLGPNRDRPHAGPVQPPSDLQVYEILENPH
jgi:hypothetical protein